MGGKSGFLSDARIPKTLVIGLGNLLLRDEGLGVRAVQRLRTQFRLPAAVEIIDGATSAMELFRSIAESKTVVIADAVRSGAAPGTLMRICGDEIPGRFGTILSPHQMALPELMALLGALGQLPERITVIGMEGGSFDPGSELSEAVFKQLDHMVQMIGDELRSFGFSLEKI